MEIPLPSYREQLKAETEKLIREANLVRDALEVPGVVEEARKFGHKILFINFTQKRLLAVVTESEQRWVVPPDTVSLEEQNALIGWMGKLQEYVMARKDRETIFVPVDGSFKGSEARFIRIGKYLADKVDGLH